MEKKVKSLVFILMLMSINLSATQWITIKNGALRKDTQGNPVQAHGAGFLQVGDIWYMVGEDRTYWNAGVNLYSSTDLCTWKFERKIIPPSAYSSDRFIERPKLLRCPSTGKFVVWCHYEGANYAASEAASFYCDSVNGIYTLSFSGRPFDIKSRDCNVFVDNDGKGYFVSTTDENANLTLFELSSDYLSPISATRLHEFDWDYREAPAIVRIGNTYFLISSYCSGWSPNQATISYSSSLKSGWSSMFSVGNGITYDTQAASILTVQGTSGTTYLYVGDRWQDPGLAESKTIIFPIFFNGTSCTFNYRQQFDIDFITGLTRETPITNRVSKTGWTIRSVSSEETSSPAVNAIDGNTSTIWHTQYSGTIASAPHFIEVDMGTQYIVSGILAAPRTDNSTNGIIRKFILTVSIDGVNWTTVAGGSWMPYHSEIYFQPIHARYFRLTALSGTYASLSEIDMLQNTPAYTTDIKPYYQINDGNWIESNNVTVLQASRLSFSPGYSGWGSWIWNGTNNQIGTSHTYSIENVTFTDAGIYSACFLDAYNQIGRVDMNVLEIDSSMLVYRRKRAYCAKRALAIYGADMQGAKELWDKILQLSGSETIDEIVNNITQLEDQMSIYIKQNIALGEDKTSLITTSQNFTSTIPLGWSGQLTGFGYGCGELFNDSSFTFSQTVLDSLPNGKYLLGVKAFYRNGSNDAGLGYDNATESQLANLYVGAKTIFVRSLYSTPYTDSGNLNGYCNTLYVANELFNDENTYFDNWLLVDVKDNQLTIKLSKKVYEENDWCAFNRFTLYRVDNVMGIHDIENDQNNKDGHIYGIDGRYYGIGTPQSLDLKPGIYIYNRKKVLVISVH